MNGRRVVLFVGITADPEHADGGLDTHTYYTIRMKHRVEGVKGILQRVYHGTQGSDREHGVDDSRQNAGSDGPSGQTGAGGEL